MMLSKTHAFAAILMTGCMIVGPALGQSNDDADAVIARAAEALGGAEALETMTGLHMYGYGQTLYQWGGGNITADPSAPPKWQANNYMQRIWDLENSRYQNLQRNNFLFPFAATFGHSFALVNQVIDGDVAFNVNADGSASRVAFSNPGALNTDGVYDRHMWSLTNPVTAVRAALVGDVEVSNYRSEDGFDFVDLTSDIGTLTLSVDGESGLPRDIIWDTAHTNLGQITYTTTFVGYMPYDGIELPMGWTTHFDWRDTLFQSTYVDGWVVNGEIPDLAAPEPIVEAGMPTPGPAPLEIEEVADRIWRITNGTTVIEFDDHLTLFELGTNHITARAVIDLAQTVNPDKPITELIVSHHHFDHTAGVRVAIEKEMTIISHADNEEILRDMATRPAPDFPEIALPEGGELNFVAVDGPMTIGDPGFEFDIYPVISNNHMATAIFLHQPDSRVMIEGDIGTAATDWQFWADSHQDNLEYYDIEVDIISPAHQVLYTNDDLIETIRPGAIRVQERCAEYEETNNFLPGCPAFIQRDW